MTDNTGTHGKLKGLKALIVGATGGIGLSVARAVAAAGADIVAHGRDEIRLAAAAAELRALGAVVSTICADLSDGEAPEPVLSAASSCDIVVVAYGPFVQKPLAATTSADWRMTALSCLALPGAIATEAATGMAVRGFGRILLFGGTRTDAIRGFRSNAAYAAAKTGLGVLAKSIAAEFAGRGVSCAVLCPGFIDTEYLSTQTKERLASASPRGGLIPAAELAEFALHLVSGGMDLANGSIIVTDRGLYAL
ncbi:MAG: short-chain dehydrogenase [Spirochaetae bacterium HGW-Spirochaetae-3]|jgi:NAD(P)-dependent dehydrogenase (short-subunit alcohol dehydrogenase family)|nr:MAG: short-chain dehydrogenase [Spirochaetae bacterium HGW-Spirochaetae-3]